jgi:tRNA (guanine-N7-)-methyltransferase
MSRALKRDIPGADWRVTEEDVRAKGWPALFAGDVGAAQPLVVEIGFGRGEFLLELARAAPDVPHLGVEYSTKRVLKMARRVARSELRNVRLMDAMGEVVVNELLGPGQAAAFWINFPDPWPKKRHHRRRLLQPALIHSLALRLLPGGLLHVATDHEGYAEAIDAALCEEALLENRFAPAPFLRDVPGRQATAYEIEWRAVGRSLHFWQYGRLAP